MLWNRTACLSARSLVGASALRTNLISESRIQFEATSQEQQYGRRFSSCCSWKFLIYRTISWGLRVANPWSYLNFRHYFNERSLDDHKGQQLWYPRSFEKVDYWFSSLSRLQGIYLYELDCWETWGFWLNLARVVIVTFKLYHRLWGNHLYAIYVSLQEIHPLRNFISMKIWLLNLISSGIARKFIKLIPSVWTGL